MIILGGGYAGLIAACMNRHAIVYEASETIRTTHDAVLRFKTDVVSKATGIPFKKVLVDKYIYDDRISEFVAPNPELNAAYSMKVSGKIHRRSIMGTGLGLERYIAPRDFLEQMAKKCESRIVSLAQVEGFNEREILFKDEDGLNRLNIPVLSTIPMPVVCEWIGLHTFVEWTSRKTYSTVFRIEGADVYNTIYFPFGSSVYRASMEGDLLKVESTQPIKYFDAWSAFKLNGWMKNNKISGDSEIVKWNTETPLGKLAPLKDEAFRRQVILNLTKDFNIYSLGRFATWRNIQLDDIVNDVNRINEIVNKDEYDRMRG